MLAYYETDWPLLCPNFALDIIWIFPHLSKCMHITKEFLSICVFQHPLYFSIALPPHGRILVSFHLALFFGRYVTFWFFFSFIKFVFHDSDFELFEKLMGLHLIHFVSYWLTHYNPDPYLQHNRYPIHPAGIVFVWWTVYCSSTSFGYFPWLFSISGQSYMTWILLCIINTNYLTKYFTRSFPSCLSFCCNEQHVH